MDASIPSTNFVNLIFGIPQRPTGLHSGPRLWHGGTDLSGWRPERSVGIGMQSHQGVVLSAPGFRVALCLLRHLFATRHPGAAKHLVGEWCTRRHHDTRVSGWTYTVSREPVQVSEEAACNTTPRCTCTKKTGVLATRGTSAVTVQGTTHCQCCGMARVSEKAPRNTASGATAFWWRHIKESVK